MGQCEAHTTRLTAFIHGTDRRANSVRALLSTDAFSAVLLASCGSVTPPSSLSLSIPKDPGMLPRIALISQGYRQRLLMGGFDLGYCEEL